VPRARVVAVVLLRASQSRPPFRFSLNSLRPGLISLGARRAGSSVPVQDSLLRPAGAHKYIIQNTWFWFIHMGGRVGNSVLVKVWLRGGCNRSTREVSIDLAELFFCISFLFSMPLGEEALGLLFLLFEVLRPLGCLLSKRGGSLSHGTPLRPLFFSLLYSHEG
jgi:hypothetical protein